MNAANKKESEPMSREPCVDNGSMGSTGKVEEQPVTASLYLKS